MKQRRFGSAVRIVAAGALATAAFAGLQNAREARAERGEGYVELEGTVDGLSGTCPKLSFTIAKTRVVTSDDTRYDDGECSDISNGRRVEVKGTMQTDGALLAKKVDLD